MSLSFEIFLYVLPDEEKMNAAIDEIRRIELEKRETAIAAEKRTISELEENLEKLRNVRGLFHLLHHLVSHCSGKFFSVISKNETNLFFLLC